ncbi:hypothetical protein PV326_010939 [Microctonus aethiopoides]|nr:hypothetical protein PV326_010939 [Microctonus aethiopoides]
MPGGKATGEDGIPIECIKPVYCGVGERIARALNKIWEGCKIPEGWEVARIIPIHKGGDKENVENYKGISLLDASKQGKNDGKNSGNRDDMEEEWDRKGVGGTVIGKQRIKVLKYADDKAVLADSAEQLKKMLEMLEKYVDKSEVMVNAEKTKGAGSGESIQIPQVWVHHKEHKRTTHKGGRGKSTKGSERDVGINHEDGKRKDERENVFDGDNSKSNSNVRGRDMGVGKFRTAEKNASKVLQICVRSGQEHAKGWKVSWKRRVSEALWKEEEWEEALEKIKEGVEEWLEMAEKREEEKIKRSTFNGAYKEIMSEREESSDAAIARMTHELKYRADETMRVLKQVKHKNCWRRKQRLSNESQDIVNADDDDDAADDEEDDDKIKYLMGYFEKISMIAEKIYKFNYLLIPDTVE